MIEISCVFSEKSMLESSYEVCTKKLIHIESYPLLMIDLSLTTEDIFFSLQEKFSQAPGFFKSAPIVCLLEGEELENASWEHLEKIMIYLMTYASRPIGFMGPSWVENVANFFHISYWPYQPKVQRQDLAKIIQTPLRSGQSLYHPGDVIIMAPVHPDAEVLASGNIHCYAPVKGRLLAGVRGSKDAKIIGNIHQAQLVSIHGICEKNLMRFGKKSLLIVSLGEKSLIIEDLDYEI